MQDDAIAEVLEAERQWVEAHRDLDLESIDRLLDDQYTQLQPGGAILGKGELLRSYSSGDRQWEIAHSEPIRVEILGETALLYGRWRGKGLNKNVPFDYETVYLAVYRRRVDGWVLVADVSLPETG